MRIPRIVTALFIALTLVAGEAGTALCARHRVRHKPRRAAVTAHVSKRRPVHARARREKASPGKGLSAAEMYHPYAPGRTAAKGAAPDWNSAPLSMERPFGTAERSEDDPFSLRLHLGRERVIDPLTQKEVLPRADPGGVGESLEKLDLKGALDKLNGKAEVHVDLFKF